MQRVVVLGASPKPDRYSNRAVKLLMEHGHAVIPVHLAVVEIEGLPVVANLSLVQGSVDTLTVYLGSEIVGSLQDEIIALKPKRVIFNPGTENAELETALEAAGIQTEEACTLVLLNTGQF